MILAEWMYRKGWTNRQLAVPLNVSEECVRLYRAGLRRPSSDVVRGIVRLTDNAVTQTDLHKAYQLRKEGKPLYGKLDRIHVNRAQAREPVDQP